MRASRTRLSVFVFDKIVNRQFLLTLLISTLAVFISSKLLFAQLPVDGSGQFSISSEGAAEYKVELEVPAGLGNFQPDLALKYNSQNGNGELGLGWQLTGVAKIELCPALLDPDGFIDGVDFDGNDRFCLGGERLTLVSGTYGADGATYSVASSQFNNITSNGTIGNGPGYFTATNSAGDSFEFGNTPDSFMKAAAKRQNTTALAVDE